VLIFVGLSETFAWFALVAFFYIPNIVNLLDRSQKFFLSRFAMYVFVTSFSLKEVSVKVRILEGLPTIIEVFF
jgi:hypothetical protein